MIIQSIAVTALGVNAYFCVSANTGIIIDPGGEPKRLIQFIGEQIEGQGKQIKAILLTHGHFDHIGAVDKLREYTGAPVYAHKDEAALLGDGSLNMSSKMRGSVIEIAADVLLSDGDTIYFDDCSKDMFCRVIHLPGHTPGGAAYYFENDEALFSGDTLFHNSIGRSDFALGDSRALIKGIREKLFTLPENVTVYPGHGAHTTIGEEKRNNPFVRSTE